MQQTSYQRPVERPTLLLVRTSGSSFFNLRGHNPSVNLDSVIRRVRRGWEADGVILARWVNSTAEYPYDQAFTDEVERQYHLLLEADINLIDGLRISETGVYSYYGQHTGPFINSPAHHQKSISRLY